MINTRNDIVKDLYEVIYAYYNLLSHNNNTMTDDAIFQRSEIGSNLDHIHFYVVYHGVNDRFVQELVVFVYHLILSRVTYIHPDLMSNEKKDMFEFRLRHKLLVTSNHQINNLQEQKPDLYTPHPVTTTTTTSSTSATDHNTNPHTHKVKIGFMSKFFGIFEPHGLLLDGVIKYLPRQHYSVYILPVARTDLKPLSPTISSCADYIHEVSLNREHALNMLFQLNLDILVFADTLSEPMTHFLAQSRIAPVQMAFWGNPVTSGSHHMDYFISADCLEHPFRTRIPLQGE